MNAVIIEYKRGNIAKKRRGSGFSIHSRGGLIKLHHHHEARIVGGSIADERMVGDRAFISCSLGVGDLGRAGFPGHIISRNFGFEAMAAFDHGGKHAGEQQGCTRGDDAADGGRTAALDAAVGIADLCLGGLPH